MAWHQNKTLQCTTTFALFVWVDFVLPTKPSGDAKSWQLRKGNVSGVENSGCAEGADRNQSGLTQLYHLQLLRAEAGRS